MVWRFVTGGTFVRATYLFLALVLNIFGCLGYNVDERVVGSRRVHVLGSLFMPLVTVD